jgi:hypothetical protein
METTRNGLLRLEMKGATTAEKMGGGTLLLLELEMCRNRVFAAEWHEHSESRQTSTLLGKRAEIVG